MDLPIDDWVADLKAADGHPLEAAGCGLDSATIAPLYHKNAEAARIANLERSHATEVSLRREVWPREDIQSKAELQFIRIVSLTSTEYQFHLWE